MPESGKEQITQLLEAWSGGDETARDRLMELLYPELKRLAVFHLSKQPGNHSLQATELLHEAYFKLIQQTRTSWQNRAHFFAIASRVMRRVIVDRSRRNNQKKRGGGVADLPAHEVTLRVEGKDVDLMALDSALDKLEDTDPEAVRIVELRFFAGLNYDEISELLSLGRATVTRRWRFTRAWLQGELEIHS